MVAQLYAFSWLYADTVMRPDLLSLARLIIGEAQRFPEIGRAYQASGPDKVLQGMIAYLETRRLAGSLAFEDAELAAQDLWGLILSAPRTLALYLPDSQPTRADIARSIHNGLKVFLKAYSTRPDQDLIKLKGLQSPVSPNRCHLTLEDYIADPANRFATVAMADTNGLLSGQMVSTRSPRKRPRQGLSQSQDRHDAPKP